MKLDELKALLVTENGLEQVLNKVNDSITLQKQLGDLTEKLKGETALLNETKFETKARAAGMSDSQIESFKQIGNYEVLLEMDLANFVVVKEINPETPQQETVAQPEVNSELDKLLQGAGQVAPVANDDWENFMAGVKSKLH